MTPDEALDEITQISQELGLYKMTEPTRKEEFERDINIMLDIAIINSQKGWKHEPIIKNFIEKWGPADE